MMENLVLENTEEPKQTLSEKDLKNMELDFYASCVPDEPILKDIELSNTVFDYMVFLKIKNVPHLIHNNEPFVSESLMNKLKDLLENMVKSKEYDFEELNYPIY